MGAAQNTNLQASAAAQRARQDSNYGTYSLWYIEKGFPL